MQRPLLLLCVDRDNDVFEKAKINGPVVGRAKNLDAAIKLALADPEDPDGNAIFYAIKLYDKFKKDNTAVEIVTIAGHKNLGYEADRELSIQLDRVIREIHPTSAMLISDGISDEEIMPIIKSRLKIDSTKIVVIKQAKELEKTYFVLIEKLRDPYYAKILLGIPAALFLLFSISSLLGWGWQPVGIVIGTYLILRGFGIDESVFRVLRDFRFSTEKTSWVGYVSGFALILIGMIIGYQQFIDGINLFPGKEKVAAYVITNSIGIFLIATLFIIAGKAIDALHDNKKFLITKYSLYTVAAILTVLVLKVGSDWVVNYTPPYVSFPDFLLTLLVSIVAGYVAIRIIKDIRKELLLKMKLEGKEVMNEHGTYIGKVIGVDGNNSALIVQTPFEKRYSLSLSSVNSVGENVIIKAG
jgi:putative membrane protein